MPPPPPEGGTIAEIAAKKCSTLNNVKNKLGEEYTELTTKRKINLKTYPFRG